MKRIQILALILFLGNPFLIYSQDIIQRMDNTTFSCKVVEITESSVLYKSWDYLTGPNRSILKSTIVKIIYEDGHVEFFNEKKSEPSTTTINNTSRTVVSSTPVISKSIEKGTSETIEEPVKLEYAPTRITYGFNSLGYMSLGVDLEGRIISDYVNIGLGYWAHGYSDLPDYSYGSFRVYMSGFAPINKLTNNTSKINRGFFPFFQPGVDMVLQFPEEGGTQFYSNFIWRVGTDFYFTDKFGISYSYSEGNLNNIGISFRW